METTPYSNIALESNVTFKNYNLKGAYHVTNKVVILGSTNVDQFLTVERYAQPGETLHVEEAQKHSAEVKVPTRYCR